MNKKNIINNFDKLAKTQIYKLCGNDKKLLAQKIVNKLSDNNIKIVNTGLVSSGKSSLFNVLIDKIDEERFKTGAARTTVSQDSELISENIYLIDTPGIDVRKEDDDIAFNSTFESDIILMIHNIKTGMPNRQEMDWLKKICSNMNNTDEIKMRLIFICSWIDERDTSEDYETTIQNTKEMVFEAAGTEIDFFEVSVKRYITGIKKNNNILIDKSNIKNFKKYLLEKAVKYKKENIMEQNIKRSINEFYFSCRNLIFGEKRKKQAAMDRIEKKYKKEYESKVQNWEKILEVLKEKYQNILSLIQERNNC